MFDCIINVSIGIEREMPLNFAIANFKIIMYSFIVCIIQMAFYITRSECMISYILFLFTHSHFERVFSS